MTDDLCNLLYYEIINKYENEGFGWSLLRPILLQLYVVEEFCLCAWVCLEGALEDCGLGQRALRHYASVLAASMSGLEVDSEVGRSCCLLDFSDDVIGKFFLKGSSSCTPLSDPCALAEANQFLSSDDSNIGNSDHWLMMVTAHAVKLAADNQHPIITTFPIIWKSSIIRPFLISSSHQLLKVHLGDPTCSFLAVGVIFSVNQKNIQKFFEGHCCFLD